MKTCFEASEQLAEAIIWLIENPAKADALLRETQNRLYERDYPDIFARVGIYAMEHPREIVEQMWYGIQPKNKDV